MKGNKGDLGYNSEGWHIRQGAYLPHWTRDGGSYFVTFRLGDSLPHTVLEEWIVERDNILKRARLQNRPLSIQEAKRLHQLQSDKIETYLDAGYGRCFLQDEAIARMVQDALKFFDDQRYELHAWCIMPNHSHIVLKPLPPYPLEKILHSWKSFTANEANRLLNRRGEFWQVESYDHLIRDEEDYCHCVEYTLANPERAGLTNWPWRGRRNVARASSP